MTIVATPPLSLEQAVGHKLMLAFAGHQPPAAFLERVARGPLGGVTLFRSLNVADPAQVRALTAALQAAARQSGQPPLLIAADQEGGTLMALAGSTQFPGNLALGATGSADLARQTGLALGRELAAVGVNVNYAPVCDVNINPVNAVVGPRSFGEDPAAVARLVAALVEGLQAAGVAATLKHFPGHGDTGVDSHNAMPVLSHDAARLERVELPPFAAGLAAGAHLVMTAHIALPALTSGRPLPATLAPTILGDLLRNTLGFRGVIISDAMEMRAISQGSGLVVDAIAAAAAGVDLLILNSDTDEQEAIYAGLCQAADRGLIPAAAVQESAARILHLKSWVAGQTQPPLEVVACAAHRALAAETATRAITLVRDTAGLLPLRLAPGARVAAVVPRPVDLTPADTSSYVTPGLAAALRRYHRLVDEHIIPINPHAGEVAAVADAVAGADLVIMGTINAQEHAGQVALVERLLASGTPVVAVALRMPYDLAAYPGAPTYLCTYSVLDTAMEALAAALWGVQGCPGRLPVSIPGLYPLGHGLDGAPA
ncbi:MAG TPA: glycoside hydrolase family 3 N-terminal domain-containing protein [Chloroflexia bacterium]|nr:glycoside hydrolase family 3 N-terminal domain-containing protein [Chloroflexia bacterium]